MFCTQLRHVGFELRLLRRRKNIHDLVVQRLTSLTIGLASARMRLMELLHERSDLLLLLIAEVEVTEPHCKAAMAMMGSGCGRLRRSLSDDRNRGGENCRRDGGEEEMGEFHGPILAERVARNLRRGLKKEER